MVDENNTESLSLIERARAERESLEKENARLEKNIKELREIETSRLLGSTSGGRVEQTPMTEADIKKKEALDFWKGTDIADAINKHG